MKLCDAVLNSIEPIIVCNTPMIEVRLFTSSELICPKCEPNKVPREADIETKIARKLGFDNKEELDDDDDTKIIEYNG
jgi:hypothetical protein